MRGRFVAAGFLIFLLAMVMGCTIDRGGITGPILPSGEDNGIKADSGSTTYGNQYAGENLEGSEMLKIGNISIIWLGQSGFEIKSDKIIYIDPFEVKGAAGKPADIILITHNHYDHLSINDIQKLSDSHTIVVASSECKTKLEASKLAVSEISILDPEESITLIGVKIDAVPAYNVNKQFHPEKDDKNGYVVSISGERIYHAGDTDFIPKMKDLTGISVALLPIGGTYTMDASEAARAAQAINPKVAVPMHYGSIVGKASDADEFKRYLEGKVKVEILKPEPPV